MNILKSVKEQLGGILGAVVRFWAVFIPLVCAAVIVSMSAANNEAYDKQILGLALAAFVMLLAHVTAEREGGLFRKIIVMLAGAAASVGYYLHILSYDTLGSIIVGRTATICFAAFVAFILVSTFGSKIDFGGAFLATFKAFFVSLLFSGVIYGGAALITAAVDTLIVDVDSDIYTHLSSIIWVVWAPMLMLSLIPRFSNSGEDAVRVAKAVSHPKFLELLLSYVLVPVLTLYTAVLVIFALKTIFGGEWDTDMLEPLILSYLFAMIILNLLLTGLNNCFAVLFRRISPAFTVAIAVFGIVSMIIANGREGIIVGRYYIIMFGIYSVTVGLVMLLRASLRRGYVGALAVLFALVCVLPVVGAYDTGIRSQRKIVVDILERNEMLKDGTLIPGDSLSNEDKEKIYESVRYLDGIDSTSALEFLPGNFNFYGDFDNVFGFLPDDSSHNKSDYYNYTISSEAPLSGAGYDYVAQAQYSSGTDGQELYYPIVDGDAGIEVLLSGNDGTETLRITADGKALVIPVYTLYDGIAENGVGDDVLESEKLIFDFENDDIKARLIFTAIRISDYSQTRNVSADIIILYGIK